MKATDQTFNYLKDFEGLKAKTPELELSFYLDKAKTKVISCYKVIKEKELEEVFFNGEELEFSSVKVNGKEWPDNYTEITDEGIKLLNLPKTESFEVTFTNFIEPEKNTDLEGLYVSGNIICTQNEPMGFRKITYSIDRPDNMVKVTTKIFGSRKEFPFMLSNGNKVDSGKAEDDLEYDTWEDPFPKPLYLFALVAGDLAELSDTYTTKTGRTIDLKFYCDHGAEKRCDFAIESLKKAMRWDEERFRLEYDLDLYMVVAVDSFNMGAMENKGLNIFNSALVLAEQSTATDTDYHRIESVIGHEYFHNWTGNRVTLKNWFQLTLKEGLTVFRDQEFSSDLNDAAVERVDMVKSLKDRQFPEDASPLAHPIRPEKYKEMNNFYTATVYEKGAEIIRMFHTLLGEEKFQKGMDEYFKLYDGKAITTEDFVNVMCSQDSKIDKDLMTRWYKTPGTPHVEIEENYDESKKTLTIEYSQTNSVAKKLGLGFEQTYIPIKASLYTNGAKVETQKHTEDQPFLSKGVYILKDSKQSQTFEGVLSDYQVSYFEDFSAPVTYNVKSSLRDLSKLSKIDKNLFNRYFSVQTSALKAMEADALTEDFTSTLKNIFKDESVSDLMKAQILEPLNFNNFVEGKAEIDPTDLNNKVQKYKTFVGETMGLEFLNFIKESPLKPYTYTLDEKGHRALRRTALDYILSSRTHKEEGEKVLMNDFKESDNMTTSFACLMLSQIHQTQNSNEISQNFFNHYKNNGLTLQKWIAAYLSCWDIETAMKRVKEVETLEEYSEKVPNFVRALWGSFIRNIQVFHDESGKGYKAALDAILKIDAINPQMSSGLMRGFNLCPKLKGACKTAVLRELSAFKNQREAFSSHLKETFDSLYSEIGA